MTDRYETPLASRYASEYMLKLFSSDTRFRTWRKLWAALAKEERILGLPITQEQVDALNAHLDDSDYDRDAFAADMGSSVSTLYNRLRDLTGKSISNYIRDIRIQEACRIAKNERNTRVSDIAWRVGFRDAKYFATAFKRITGKQPKEYFAELREES